MKQREMRHGCFEFVLMKIKVVPEEQSERCPCQACVIFKVGTDSYRDKLLFIGATLNRAGILFHYCQT